MKAKTFMKRSLLAMVCIMIICTMAVAAVSCDKKNNSYPSVNIASDKDAGSMLKKGDTVSLLVAVSDNSAYELSVNCPEVAQLNGNKLKIISDVNVDTEVIVTVKLKYYPVTKEIKFIVKAPVEMPTISMTASKADNTRLEIGDEITFSASASNNGDIALSVDKTDVGTLTGNTLKITGEVNVETIITVTATLVDFPSVKTSRSFRIKPKLIEGQVLGNNGALTTQMIQALGSQNITVTGTLTDYYMNNSTKESMTSTYDMLVKMSEGKWYGAFNAKGSSNVLVDNYRMSVADGYTNQNGVSGHALERIYIDKNNTVKRSVVRDGMSYPAVWEAQHLWNHIDNLAVNVGEKFVYDPENDVFQYVWMTVDSEGFYHYDESDLYLMTYLAFSLTPILDETIQDLYFVVDNGVITKLMAKTETLYDGGATTSASDATEVSYTEIVLTFSDIGNTVVPDPTPYEAPEHVEILEQAIAKMQAAKNFTFSAVDVTTYAPSGDPGDYELSSAAGAASVSDGTYASGTEGLVGRVTEDAILLQRTTKYAYSMDDKVYKVEYSGYKKIDDSHYDEFDYINGALRGTHQQTGTLNDVLPSWDFSANVFELASAVTKDGKTTYIFVLRDSQIVVDVVKEVSMYYASDAVASSGDNFRITVDEEGNILNTKYPYELSSSFAGTITTTYSNIGTTAFTEGEFDGYVPRVVPDDWSDLSTDRYYYKHTILMDKYDCYDKENNVYHANKPCDHEATLDVVINNVFGDNASAFPTISLFIDVFGDYIYTPYFYDYKEIVNADKTKEYIDFVSMTTEAPAKYLDENNNLTDDGFSALLTALNTAMAREGFNLSIANTDYSGGESGRSDRYICYTNGKVQIVINNNHTRHFRIYIYNDGDWTLKK